jgi:hypothetical protein
MAKKLTSGPGLPDFSSYNILKRDNWFENIPFGNPGDGTLKRQCVGGKRDKNALVFMTFDWRIVPWQHFVSGCT